MDINFHYFAIKSLAVRAGFSPEEAQTLAEYSQLVDDYNRSGTVLFKDVPPCAQHLAEKHGDTWRFCCITTGFSSFLDMAELVLAWRQRYICIPFHFIPPQALNVAVPNEAAWRTEPETLTTTTVLGGMLHKAKARYRAAPAARENLIGLALLLHIFADTYAHQRFSGYGGWWNHGTVLKAHCHTGKRQRVLSAAMKRMGQEDVLEKDRHLSVFVGHMSFGHAPDKSSLSFSAVQKSAPGSALDLHYSRDNTEIFLQASRVIFNFLRDCRGLSPVSDAEWEPVGAAMRQGFLTQETDAALLAAHWQVYFPDIAYAYSLGRVLKRSLRVAHLPSGAKLRAGTASAEGAEEADLEQMFSPLPSDTGRKKRLRAALRKDALITPVGEDFFWFNVFAKEVRDTVNGEVTPLK